MLGLPEEEVSDAEEGRELDGLLDGVEPPGLDEPDGLDEYPSVWETAEEDGSDDAVWLEPAALLEA